MIQVGTNSEIIFDGQPTGYGVKQFISATNVYPLDGSRSGIGMPRSRYSLAQDMPSHGVAGRAEFERDFCAVTGREIPESTLAKLKAFEPLDVLLGYPTKALVSEFYDVTDGGDQAFGSALIHIFGDSFEYPDFSYRTVGAVVKMAVKKLEQSGLDGGAKVDQEAKPDMCFAFNESAGPGHFVVAIRRGESGFFKTSYDEKDAGNAQKLVHLMNGKLGVSAEEAEHMHAGSMFGWNVPGAQVKTGPVKKLEQLGIDQSPPVTNGSDKSKLAADLLSGHPDEALALDLYKSDPSFTAAMDSFVVDLAAANDQAEQAMAKSTAEAEAIAHEKGPYAFIDAKVDQSLLGKVLAVTDSHVVLSLGRSAAIVAQSDLSRVPAMGEDATIVFKDGKGLVADIARKKGIDCGR